MMLVHLIHHRKLKKKSEVVINYLLLLLHFFILLKIKVPKGGFHSDAVEESFTEKFLKRHIFLSVKNIT